MPFIKPSKAGEPANPNAAPGIAFASPDANPADVMMSLSGVPTQGQQQGQPHQPQPQQQQQGAYPAYVLRRMETARKYNCEYRLEDEDIKRIQFDRYKQVFKDSLTRNVTMVRRIRVRRPGESQFSEWLAYYVTDSIWDDAGEEHQWQQWMGVEQEPVPQVKYNALREVESINFDQRRASYTIPWSKENVDAALKDSLIVPTDLAIAYAPTMATKDIWSGNELTIHNLDELTEFDFDVLERANHGGWVRKPYGGVADMLKYESDEESREKELGPNMFPHMPPIEQMKAEVRKYDAEQARIRKQQQTQSREKQIENQQVQEEAHSKEQKE